LTTPETPKIDPPEGLSADAVDLFEDVVAEHGQDLGPERFGALIQACRLVSLADRAEAAIGHDLLTPGYKGQPVANPLLSEVRLARVGAVQALKSAGLTPNASPASAAGASLASKRWHSSPRTRAQ
jgi:hypothetical protein